MVHGEARGHNIRFFLFTDGDAITISSFMVLLLARSGCQLFGVQALGVSVAEFKPMGA